MNMKEQGLKQIYQQLVSKTAQVVEEEKNSAGEKEVTFERVQSITQRTHSSELHKQAEFCLVRALSRFKNVRSRAARQHKKVLELKREYSDAIAKLGSLVRDEHSTYAILNEVANWLTPEEVGEIELPRGCPDLTEFMIDDEVARSFGPQP
jgi:hypothetical protein